MPTSTTTIWRPRSHRLTALTGAGLLALAACSSSGSSGGTGTGGAPAGGRQSHAAANTTVAVASISGTKVLETPAGRALYVNDQEHNSIACTSSGCTAIWPPLTLGSGEPPSAPSGVSGTLGTLKRPDGKTQVTLNGQPLYTFSFDHAAGKVGGDGKQDSFDGTEFTWHLATASGTAAASRQESSSSPGGGYNYP